MKFILIMLTFFLLVFCQDKNYKNPVLFSNIPDPGVIYLEPYYYSVSTSNYNNKPDNVGDGLFPIFYSRDLVQWNFLRHVFADKQPVWAMGDFWAPELLFHKVNSTTTGIFVYFTARQKRNRVLAIGCAYLDLTGRVDDMHNVIEHGEFVDLLQKPFYEEPNQGNIDGHPFVNPSDGFLYFLWKNDGNDFRPPQPCHIYLQKMENSGLALDSHERRHTLLTNNKETWELDVVEAPWLIQHQGKYFLFYSGGPFYNEKYGIGVAISNSLFGPYHKQSNNPILRTSSQQSGRRLKGPGHCSVVKCPSSSLKKLSLPQFEDEEMVFVAIYHAWYNQHDILPPGRVLNIDQVHIRQSDGHVRINDGSPSEAKIKSPCA